MTIKKSMTITKKQEHIKTDSVELLNQIRNLEKKISRNFEYDNYVNDCILNLYYKTASTSLEIERLKRRIKQLEAKK